jgi:hypothetical protein
MSHLVVPKDIYLTIHTSRLAELILSGLDLLAAKEQVAWEMRDWHSDEIPIVEDERDGAEKGIYS